MGAGYSPSILSGRRFCLSLCPFVSRPACFMRSLATLCNTFERLCDALLRSYIYENFEKFAFCRCAEVCVLMRNRGVTDGQSRPDFAQDSLDSHR